MCLLAQVAKNPQMLAGGSLLGSSKEKTALGKVAEASDSALAGQVADKTGVAKTVKKAVKKKAAGAVGGAGLQIARKY